MSTKIKELKAELKKLALDIRQAKIVYKDQQRGNGSFCTWAKENGLFYNIGQHTIVHSPTQLTDTYRHKHIVYCLLRGRKYAQIENNVREGNEPRWTLIEKLLKQYQVQVPDLEVANG